MNWLRFISFIFVFVPVFWIQTNARNLDSLWALWNNTSLHDTLRLNALDEFAWDGFGYSRPDSAFYYAQLEYDYAKSHGYSRWMAKALNTQGNTFIVRSEYVKAYDFFVRSLEISDTIPDKMAQSNSLHRIGIIYYFQGDNSRAIDYYLKSLKLREELQDKKGISGSLNNIGIVYSQQAQYPKALEFFTRSLDLSRELEDKRVQASSLNNIGLIYKATGQLDKAYDNFLLSMEISDQLGDKRDVAAAWNNLALVFEEQGKLRQALESFNKSIQIKESIGDKQGLSVSQHSIGSIYQKQGDHKRAIAMCLLGLKNAEEIGAIPEQEKACECLYVNYKALHQEVHALAYHERKLLLSDSLQNQQTTRMLQHMEFSKQMLADSIARVDEKSKIQAAHRLEVAKKNKMRNVLLGSTIMLLVGAVGLYSRIRLIRRSRAEIAKEKDRSDKLLLNILPAEIAHELKEKGEATARKFENVSILFTDFSDFTQLSVELSPEELVKELNTCFKAFDAICEKYKIETIKTIGDAYMAAGGLPVPSPDSAKNTVLAAFEMNSFMDKRNKERIAAGKIPFEMRSGIHTGPVVAGIVGVKKFQYDVWGDTVNIASRMESSGEVGKINISKETYDLIKDDPALTFEHRGKLMAKGKGCTEMYFVVDWTTSS